MERIVRNAGAVWQRILLPGAVTFLSLTACGYLHAQFARVPAPPLIATWCEWFAALVFLPYVFTLGAFGRWGKVRAIAPVVHGWRVALVVFALDLLMRAVLGLGLTPFYTG